MSLDPDQNKRVTDYSLYHVRQRPTPARNFKRIYPRIFD